MLDLNNNRLLLDVVIDDVYQLLSSRLIRLFIDTQRLEIFVFVHCIDGTKIRSYCSLQTVPNIRINLNCEIEETEIFGFSLSLVQLDLDSWKS